MMTRFALILGWLLAFLPAAGWCAASPNLPSPAPAVEAEPVSNSVLAQGLETWNRLSQRITRLEAENMAWEARFNPDREDHNWWNPFWRSTAERQLEESNAISLKILALERQREELEPRLSAWAENYIRTLPSRAASLTAEEREFWFQTDAWRIPFWLRRFQDLKKNLERNAELSPELKLRRQQSLEQLRLTAKSLDTYLTWRQAQLGREEKARLQEQRAWQKQIQAWLAATAAWQ